MPDHHHAINVGVISSQTDSASSLSVTSIFLADPHQKMHLAIRIAARKGGCTVTNEPGSMPS